MVASLARAQAARSLCLGTRPRLTLVPMSMSMVASPFVTITDLLQLCALGVSQVYNHLVVSSRQRFSNPTPALGADFIHLPGRILDDRTYGFQLLRGEFELTRHSLEEVFTHSPAMKFIGRTARVSCSGEKANRKTGEKHEEQPNRDLPLQGACH